MKIAVTYDNGNVFSTLERQRIFKVYEVEDNKVVSSEVIGSNGTDMTLWQDFLQSRRSMSDLWRHRRRCTECTCRGWYSAVFRCSENTDEVVEETP